jgi:ABC-type polysaccharide/polyol phosphate transport system ATPase subunit
MLALHTHGRSREDVMNEPVIEADGLVKEFARGARALDGLSLAVPRGTVYGLLGPNGAGKTTLIRILATLLAADAGTARVAGIDVGRHPAAVRDRIGLAGQYAAVDDYLTGRENIELAGRLYGLSRREAKQRTAEILERTGLAGAADLPVKTYSGGCAAGSISPRPWPGARRCCSWTSPLPASTRPAAAACGGSSATWPAPGPRSC